MNKNPRESSCELRRKSVSIDNIHNEMTENVRIHANDIFKEFERLISFHGSDVVENLMPLIVGVLENLEELYRIKQSSDIELELLKDDNTALNNKYEKEKVFKKQAEETSLRIEYTYEEEKKLFEEKILTMESTIRLFEIKVRNSSDTILRLEEKIQTQKTDYQKLYDRYTDMLKSHAEQVNRIRADTFRDLSPSQMQSKLGKSPKLLRHEIKLKSRSNSGTISTKAMEIESLNQDGNLPNERFDHLGHISQKMCTSDYTSHEEENMADILINDQWMYDYSIADKDREKDQSCYPNTCFPHNNSGFFIDSREISYRMNQEHSLEMNNVDSDIDMIDDEFGIGKEIEFLIRENQELIDTKNALNVVKDDLISRLDLMTSDNDILREDITHYANREADIKAKLAYVENEWKACKEEVIKLKESISEKAQEDPLISIEQKTFSRSELAVLLEEKNYYKERLMELQDAVVYKEMCRVKKQFPELKESQKAVKQNNSSIWNLFGNVFKKEEEELLGSIEKSKNLISRFKHDSDRSQLYSWSVPRSLIESTLPKRIPIPIKIQTVFEPKDMVICATPGYEECQSSSSAEYLWCLVQSNVKNNKNYYLLQMGLTEKVPELTNKYSIRLQFPTTPFTMCEVPALAHAISDYNSLISEDTNGHISSQSPENSSVDEADQNYKIFPTKVQIKNKIKNCMGTKTIWFGCEKNQVIVYLLLDNNKVENLLATLTMESEIEFIRYHIGRIFVIEKNGSMGIFDLNKEMNHWELNLSLLINISEGLPISDLCCDSKTRQLWIGSSTNCFILHMPSLQINKSLHIFEESNLSSQCTSIESMVIVEKYSLMLISASRIGLLLGYDLKSFQFRLSLDLKPSVFDLIEPIHGIEKSTLSLFHLTVDNERIWMTSDCGMTLVVTLETLGNHLNQEYSKTNKSRTSIQTDQIYISSHAFAQCIKFLSILAYSSATLSLENSTKSNNSKENSNSTKDDSINKKTESESDAPMKKYFFMTAIGGSYVNLNNLLTDMFNPCNHAITWKI